MRIADVRRGTLLVLAGLALVSASACSFSASIGDTSVDKEEVAEQAAVMLEEQVGQAPDDITCPEDLPGEVGASITCELTAGGDKLGVTVTTTEVDGSTVKFNVKVDEQPTG